VLLGIAVGCAAGAVGFVPSASVGQAGARGVEQYCTDTGDFNNTEALNGLVQKAGSQGWELVTVARAEAVGMSKADYVCFRRAR
jgi:hypothetical protein